MLIKITPGLVDPAIVCLEQRLIELGYPAIVGPDTTYDTTSVGAVMSFQTSRGHADGIITSVTARQLGLRGAMPPAGSALEPDGDSTSAAMRWFTRRTTPLPATT